MPANLGVSCDQPIIATLDLYSERTGIPKSVVVSRLLHAFFEKVKAELPEPVVADMRKPTRRKGMG